MLAYADYAPLAGVFTRIAIIAVAWLIAAAVFGFKLWRKRRAEKALEAAVVGPPPVEDDSAQLSERMTDAIATLKRSSGKRNYLYSLPWYMIIGPPGAGKTTALVNSGLSFPLHEKGARSSIAGTGGTRFCDWWFTEEAVLIDTAGRYTTHDSDAESDKKSWLSFLSMLKATRPKQPINGVIIAISLADIMSMSAEDLDLHATAIRKRLLELYETLKVEFPVYALFTKADLVSGFGEFFSAFNEDQRRQVWGATFQVKERRENCVARVPAEIDDLVLRLMEETADRLQVEPDALNRIAIFGFPSQVAELKDSVSQFLAKIFEPTRYHANVNLRGFYFTSGTQEGTPIDQLLGAMESSFSTSASGFMSGKGKSFFLHDLMTKVIFSEAGWVSRDMKAVRRSAFLRYGALTAMLAITAGLSAVWYLSYLENRGLVDRAMAAAASYDFPDNAALSKKPLDKVELREILPPLRMMRELEAGYENRGKDGGWLSGLGLSQRDQISTASIDAYRVALERTLRPRLMLRLERQLADTLDDPPALYEMLKVYLTLAGLSPENDDELLKSWMRDDWENVLFPGAQFKQGREVLEQHLSAMLELDDGYDPMVRADPKLVDRAQKSILRMSMAERAYAVIKSAAKSDEIPAWNLADVGGSDTKVVFETLDGRSVSDIQIDGLYTYNGFYYFMYQTQAIREKLQSDMWVLGDYAEQKTVEAQVANIDVRLAEKYEADFIRAWEDMMKNLQWRNLADKPKYETLQIATSDISPIRSVLQSISDETRLSVERKEDAESAIPDTSEVKDAMSELGQLAARRTADRFSGLTRAGMEIFLRKATSRKSQSRLGDEESTFRPGQAIETHFKSYQLLMTENKEGAKPVDALFNNLRNIQGQLMGASDPTAQASPEMLRESVRGLRSNISRLPGPVARMTENAIRQFEGDVASSSVAQIESQLMSEVTANCREIIRDRYPFNPRSNEDVPMADFVRLFAPNGMIERFFQDNLAQYADRQGEMWTWKKNNRIGTMLKQDILTQFQRASEITEAFFPGGSPQLGAQMIITPQKLANENDTALLNIDRDLVELKPVPSPSATVVWPNMASATAGLTFFPQLSDRDGVSATTGPWALMRLFAKGKVSPAGGQAIKVRLNVDGKTAELDIQFSSDRNPFVLPALTAFKCPEKL